MGVKMSIKISRGVWLDTAVLTLEISWLKRVVLSEIIHLTGNDLGCIAGNKHFADKFMTPVQSISRSINELEKEGYIEIDNSKTIRNVGRVINLKLEIVEHQKTQKQKDKYTRSFEEWFSTCWDSHREYILQFRDGYGSKQGAKTVLWKTTQEILKIRDTEEKYVLDALEEFIYSKRKKIQTQYLENSINSTDLLDWAGL